MACKAILAAISALDFDHPDGAGADDDDGRTFVDKLTGDPIAHLRVLIRVVSFFWLGFSLSQPQNIFRYVLHLFVDSAFRNSL